MSFLSGILPLAGAAAGSFFGLPGAALGASLGGALGGSLASSDAADAQSQAAQQAQDTQWRMFQQQQQNLAPWMKSGQQANNQLMSLLGLGGGGFDPNAPLVKPFAPSDLTTDPSYQWRLGQGENALLNRASALGGLGGGNTMKAITDYGQNAASQEYQNAFARYNQNQQNLYQRLAGLSNTGVNAAGSIAGLGANAANNVSGLQYAQGQANAGGILGQQNALGAGLGNGINNWLLASALQQQGFGGGGGLNITQLGNPAGFDYGLNGPM